MGKLESIKLKYTIYVKVTFNEEEKIVSFNYGSYSTPFEAIKEAKKEGFIQKIGQLLCTVNENEDFSFKIKEIIGGVPLFDQETLSSMSLSS